ncbi:glucose 1-dehydrogenase [Oryzobacter telluris]|jgi:NAD(P)-dependent dehydrogenase (short-subunit alcohol dehydrogenase family)|uniref:glucose 1-dehydrogenase n=1 Tax=Oryzobacter telluris TaxID=3149179 RepID=UPI00370D62D0
MTDRPTHVPAQQQQWPGTDADLQPPADHGASSWTGRGRLTGKRAVVTGGDSGIGRAVAVTFAKEGADVLIAHLPEEADDARATADLVREAGRTAVLHAADLRTVEAVRALAEEAVQALGGVDVLVCNAAFQMTHDELAEFPPEQLERTFATNVLGPFWLVQALAPELADGGSVIVTTSIQAYSPSDHLLDYAATKAALNNLVVNLAQELGPKGTRVNAVAPGPIWTPLIPATMAPDKVEGFGGDTPLGRPGQPVEVAAAFVFLASDEASYVSGTVLGVTGGKPVF